METNALDIKQLIKYFGIHAFNSIYQGDQQFVNELTLILQEDQVKEQEAVKLKHLEQKNEILLDDIECLITNPIFSTPLAGNKIDDLVLSCDT